MHRKIEDTVRQMLEGGTLTCKDNTWVRSKEFHVYEPIDGIEFEHGDAESTSRIISLFHMRSPFELKIRTHLSHFFSYCDEHDLPAHNPAAFFSAVMDKEKELCETPQEKAALKEMLLYALAGDGFVFGTTFNRERSRQIRPSDYLPVTEENGHLYSLSLDSHASLRSVSLFLDDLGWYRSKILEETTASKMSFQSWNIKKDAVAKHKQDFSLVLQMSEVQRLVSIYKQYIALQEELGGTILSKPEVRKVLKQFWSAQEAILVIADHCDKILRAKTIEERKYQITLFSEYLNAKSNQAVFQKIDDLDKKHPFINSTYFAAIRRYPDISKDQERSFPTLDKKNDKLKLKRDERDSLNAYKKHSLIQWISAMEKALSNQKYQEIAPYFITCNLLCKANPQKVKRIRTFSLTDEYTSLTDDIKVVFSNSEFFEKSHRFLYTMLAEWWDEIASTRDNVEAYDKRLCDYLYDRNRKVLAEYDYHSKEDGGYSRFATMDPLALTAQYIGHCFVSDPSDFPQYAKCRIANREMLTSTVSFLKDREDDWRIETKVSESITELDVEAYKQLALLDRNGIGIGRPTAAWHIKLAQWFDSILWREDDNWSNIRAYISRNDTDSYYPGTNIPISEINAGVEWLSPSMKLYSEDYYPNLARVELAIQKACCDRIYGEMAKEVVRLYKRVFWGDDLF